MPYRGADGNIHWTEEEIIELYGRLSKLEEYVKNNQELEDQS